MQEPTDTFDEPIMPVPRAPRPIVAIVGRPNVGKSSIFNALLGRRAAIVHEEPGTTRDRLTAGVEYDGRRMLLVDTGGLVPEPETEIEAHIAAQVATAVDGADVVLLVTDARPGLTPPDRDVAELLRRSGKPVVLVANKVDTERHEVLALEAQQLGLGDAIPVSALHHRGLDDMLEAVVAHLPPPEEGEPEDSVAGPHIAIVGRPNVGKSALANVILGAERSIVSEVPGTTRDALDTPFTFRAADGRELAGVIIDTAGIRRRGAVHPGIERYSVLRAVRAIDRSDVVFVLLDATELATDQDLHIAGEAREAFKSVVVVVNKWDLIPEATRREARVTRKAVLTRLRFMSHVPVVFTSALLGEGIDMLLRTASDVYRKRMQQVSQPELTKAVMNAIARHLPPTHLRGSLKIYRVKQESVGPPTFVFYCNNPDRVHFSYERFLENTIREAFDFEGTHLRLEFRGRGKSHIIGQSRSRGVGGRRPKTTPAPRSKTPPRPKTPPGSGARARSDPPRDGD